MKTAICILSMAIIVSGVGYAPAHATQSTTERIDDSMAYQPLAEPVFKKVEYLSPEAPGYVEEQIENLVSGIQINLTPEYDMYGYEIRRYMASIAGPEVLASKEKIKQQLLNIKKAEIILDHWRASNNEKVKAIRAEMDTGYDKASLRSSFNYQNAIANAFFTEAQSWIDNNRALLIFMYKLNKNSYEYDEPFIIFNERDTLIKFKSLMDAQKAALKQIHKYLPFRTMVY